MDKLCSDGRRRETATKKGGQRVYLCNGNVRVDWEPKSKELGLGSSNMAPGDHLEEHSNASKGLCLWSPRDGGRASQKQAASMMNFLAHPKNCSSDTPVTWG